MIVCHPSALLRGEIAITAFRHGYHIAERKGRVVWVPGRRNQQAKRGAQIVELNKMKEEMTNDR